MRPRAVLCCKSLVPKWPCIRIQGFLDAFNLNIEMCSVFAWTANTIILGPDYLLHVINADVLLYLTAYYYETLRQRCEFLGGVEAISFFPVSFYSERRDTNQWLAWSASKPSSWLLLSSSTSTSFPISVSSGFLPMSWWLISSQLHLGQSISSIFGSSPWCARRCVRYWLGKAQKAQ